MIHLSQSLAWSSVFLAFITTSTLIAQDTRQKASTNLVINGDTPWVISSADFKNPAIQAAVRNAERDWYKVFGVPPVIFKDSLRRAWTGPVLILGSVENTKHLVDNPVPQGKERFRLTLTRTNHNSAIAAVGTDTRGTIYAIYSFTEEILGIDPMHVFTDSQPARREEITIPHEFDIVSKEPTFEHRGWFINDEEIHDGLHRDPLGGNVISMEWMDKILETLLRCKGNMIIPESAPFPDATVYDLCKRRAVIITHHHVTPLGVNMMHWPKKVPYSYIKHKDILEDAWQKSAQAQADKEVAWIIGFRGESDGPFWNSDPAAPKSPLERAQVISAAMKRQAEIVREISPEATIVAALWNEQGAFYNEGLLEIPAGVCKMFADDGRGFMRDDGGVHVSEGDGLYYHVMMMMNSQNRTTEAVPPARFYRELKRYVDKGATKYAIINVSGIRPAVMSVQAITDFLWDAETALSKSPEEAMKDYLNRWHAKQFSPELAPRLTELRLKYYDIPYMRPKMPTKSRWRGAHGEHLIQHQIQGLIGLCARPIQQGEALSSIDQFTKLYEQAVAPLDETEDFFPALWQEVKELEKEIPDDRKDFYQAHFTYQVAVHMYSCRALAILRDAIEEYQADQNAQAFAENLTPALEEIEKLIAEAHKAEYGIWDTMFMHVRLMDIWRTRLLIKETIAKVEGKPYTSSRRGYYGGSFWGSAQDYFDTGDGVFPYFYKSSGRGLDVLENASE